MIAHCRSRLLAGLLVLASSAALAPEAAAQRADALVRADLAFAEGLAERYRYTDLAESVVAAVERAGVGNDLAEDVSLAKCSILAEGARYEGNPEKRIELFDKTLSAYSDFLEKYPHSELGAQAERAYVDLTNRYTQFLEDALQDQVGEEAQATREKIKETLEGGLERVRDILELLQDGGELSPSQEAELYGFMLAKGQMQTTQALIAEDGTFYFAQAEETLEEVALIAGEQSGAGLQAFLQMARVKRAQGIYDEAAEFALYVVDFMVPMDPSLRQDPNWVEQPFELKQRRWGLVELGMPELLGAYSDAGNIEDGIAAALYFYNALKSEGFEVGPLGHLSLLAVARTLLESGGYVGGSLAEGDLQWFDSEEAMTQAGYRSSRNARSSLELALRICKDVNEANRGNVLQVRAQRLISEVIDRPGISVSPDVLFEAAEGEYNAGNYDRAMAAYRRLMRQLEAQDEATRVGQMPRVLNGLGRTLTRLERPLEGAMAFREAATAWKGDPEFQKKNADGYYQAIGVVRRSAPQAAEIERLYLQAENLAAEAATGAEGAGEIHWRRGERHYGQKQYEEARGEYLQVDPSDDLYEKARTKAALCHYKLGNHAAARQEFTEYLQNFVPDPANTVTTKGKIDTRDQASAMATYYLGLMANKASDWNEVIEQLGDYGTRFREQTDYAPAAMRLLLKAQIAESNLSAARSVLESMREHFGDHPQTGAAAAEAAKALEPLIDAAEKAGDEAEVVRLKTERAEFLSLGNSLSGSPNYPNLRNESVLWIELGEWVKAEAALRKLLAKFGGSAQRADDVESRVLPDLGLVLLEQKRVPEAFEVLDPLVPDPGDKNAPKPRSETVESWCRAVSGWVEGDESTIVEVPGVGDAESFADATSYWLKLTSQEDKWTCSWYELRFLNFYAYYRWGQLDSKKLAETKEYLESLRTTSQDPEFKLVSDRCGNEVLRKRFQWLWEKVK